AAAPDVPAASRVPAEPDLAATLGVLALSDAAAVRDSLITPDASSGLPSYPLVPPPSEPPEAIESEPFEPSFV
ncbi:MAG: hypothetical protein AB8B63_15230, partial [Granulosicoccus sp.]